MWISEKPNSLNHDATAILLDCFGGLLLGFGIGTSVGRDFRHQAVTIDRFSMIAALVLLYFADHRFKPNNEQLAALRTK
jgi:hypothetical protein